MPCSQSVSPQAPCLQWRKTFHLSNSTHSVLFFSLSCFSFHPLFSISVSKLTSITAFLKCVQQIYAPVYNIRFNWKLLLHKILPQFCLPSSWHSHSGLCTGFPATYRWLIFRNVSGTQTVWTAAFITDSSASSINVDKYFPQAISFRHSTALTMRGEGQKSICWEWETQTHWRTNPISRLF